MHTLLVNCKLILNYMYFFLIIFFVLDRVSRVCPSFLKMNSEYKLEVKVFAKILKEEKKSAGK